MRILTIIFSFLFLITYNNVFAKGIGKDDLQHLFQIFLKGQPEKHSEQLDLYLHQEKSSNHPIRQSKITQFQFQIAQKKQLQQKRKRLKALMLAYNRVLSLQQKSTIATSNVVELAKINKMIEQSRKTEATQADFRLAFSYIAEADQVSKTLIEDLTDAEKMLTDQYQNLSEVEALMNIIDSALPEKEDVKTVAFQQHEDLILKNEQLKFATYLNDTIKIAGLTAYLAAAKEEVGVYIDDLYSRVTELGLLKSELKYAVEKQLEQRNIAYSQYDQGKKTWQDVLAVQKELILKQLELVSVEYGYEKTALMIAVEIGTFDESTLIDNAQITYKEEVEQTDKAIGVAPEVKKGLAEAKPVQPEQEPVVKPSLSPLLFERLVLYNQPNLSKLTNNSQTRLEEFVTELLKHDDLTVQVRGYIASKNDTEENQKLSEKRAINVKKMMLKLGVRGDRVETIGMSNRDPIATNNTRAGRSKNRRVEVTVNID